MSIAYYVVRNYVMNFLKEQSNDDYYFIEGNQIMKELVENNLISEKYKLIQKHNLV